MESHEFNMNDIFDDEDDADQVEESENADVGGNQDEEKDDGDKENEEQSKKKTPRIVKNPRPKMDFDRLCGNRGIAILPEVFEKVKLKGKGYEREDLNSIMSALEQWSHRLFASGTFDAVLERIEKLGDSKRVQANVNKIRLGMNTLHEEFQRDASDNEGPQVETMEEDVFDELLRQHEPPMETQQPVTASTGSVSTSVSTPSSWQADLSEEQKATIERNRQLAIERRKARWEAQQASLESSNITIQDNEEVASQKNEETQDTSEIKENNTEMYSEDALMMMIDE